MKLSFKYSGTPITQPPTVVIDDIKTYYFNQIYNNNVSIIAYCDFPPQVLAEWNKGELDSFLIEITKDILAFKDSDGTPLVEKIRDSAGQVLYYCGIFSSYFLHSCPELHVTANLGTGTSY